MLKIFLILHFFICVGILIAQPIDTTYESSTQATQDPTYSNIVKPQNVLVVFRNDDSVSIAIKNYYVNKRGILATNVLGLDIPDTADYDGERVILWHGTEVIKRDDYCSDDGSNGVCDTLVWHYYNEKIALPTSSYLNNTFDNSTNQYLKDQIDYIVLCKGIPIKLNSGDRGWLRYWPSYNISLDGLLCLLQTENNNNPSIMKLYPIPPTYGYNCYVDNTYRGIDLSFNFNHRFKANHYITNKTLNDNTTAEFKIACLVSHLDGRNLTDVLRMIDNNCLADKSGQGKWIIDGHHYYSWETQYWQGYNNYNTNNLISTANKLGQYGFNVYCDGDSRNYIYDNNDNSQVIGYMSWGVHSGMPTTYYDSLNFDLADGSITNTIESYNCTSMDPNYRIDNQGLVADFIHILGSCGVGHAFEPILGPNNNSYYIFPAYAMGYNMVEAAYQGIQKLAWQNIVVGDPLTTIAWGKQTIVQNIELTSTNLVTDTIFISIGDTVSFADNSTINLKHHGFVVSNESSVLTLGNNVSFSSDSWDRGLLLANNHDHPQLMWTVNPSMSPINYYKVFRKIDTGAWIQADSTTENVWTDSSLNFEPPEGQLSAHVYYYVKSYNSQSSSDPSNTVDATVGKSRQKMKPVNDLNQFAYILEQNYPNPFNPTTSIKYSLKNDGIVSLKVYDILGREMADLINQAQKAGYHSVNFDASRLASGVYTYQLRVNDYVSSKKMLLLK